MRTGSEPEVTASLTSVKLQSGLIAHSKDVTATQKKAPNRAKQPTGKSSQQCTVLATCITAVFQQPIEVANNSRRDQEQENDQ